MRYISEYAFTSYSSIRFCTVYSSIQLFQVSAWKWQSIVHLLILNKHFSALLWHSCQLDWAVFWKIPKTKTRLLYRLLYRLLPKPKRKISKMPGFQWINEKGKVWGRTCVRRRTITCTGNTLRIFNRCLRGKNVLLFPIIRAGNVWRLPRLEHVNCAKGGKPTAEANCWV